HVDVCREDTEFRLTFTWITDQGELPFTAGVNLNDEDLDSRLAFVRQALLECATSETLSKNLENGDSQGLRQLARMGNNLWNLIFNLNPGSAIHSIGEMLRDKPLPEGALIQISSDAKAAEFVLTWNLLYDRPLGFDESAEIDPMGFWGLRYIIEQRVPGKVLDTDVPVTIGPELEAGFFSWHFDELQNHRAFVEGLSAPPKLTVPHYDSRPKALVYLEKFRSHILYFFTHGHTQVLNSASYATSHEPWMNWYNKLPKDSEARRTFADLHENIVNGTLYQVHSHIQLRFGRIFLEELYGSSLYWKSRPIVFLNMCQSAQVTPSFSQSFVHFFLTRGAEGVIGTECSMNPLFAAHFGEAFLEDLLSGEPTGAILLQLRRRYMQIGNPLGLAYTLFGRATSSIQPPILVRADAAKATTLIVSKVEGEQDARK
ncbi:MAG: hypothetical protein ACRD7E_27835, partial [Bryobacteraceae bacterium]